jgi:hypothetical protein
MRAGLSDAQLSRVRRVKRWRAQLRDRASLVKCFARTSDSARLTRRVCLERPDSLAALYDGRWMMLARRFVAEIGLLWIRHGL